MARRATDLASLGLQLAPELEGAAEQGHVGAVLVVRQAYNPGQAVRGALVVRDAELLQAQHLRDLLLSFELVAKLCVTVSAWTC